MSILVLNVILHVKNVLLQVLVLNVKLDCSTMLYKKLVYKLVPKVIMETKKLNNVKNVQLFVLLVKEALILVLLVLQVLILPMLLLNSYY